MHGFQRLWCSNPVTVPVICTYRYGSRTCPLHCAVLFHVLCLEFLRPVPDAPAAATVVPYSGTDLYVEWVPPLSDGGSQVTGYRVDWDTNPGNFEVQTLQTTPYLGPNEIQSLTLFASVVPEMQSFHTRAAAVAEVQTVRTFANTNEVLGGSFTLSFDTTATGGGYYVSAQISNAAFPSTGGPATRESMEEILEAMPNIEDVVVSRVGPDEQGGYTWSVTFITPPGNVAQLKLATSSLTGNGAGVETATATPGNEISGSFRIAYNGEVTGPLSYDATPSQIQTALSAFSQLGVVEVSRTGPNVQRGYSWSITFVDNMNSGDLPAITIDGTNLTSTGSAVTVSVCANGVVVGGTPCTAGTSVRGNQLDDHISPGWLPGESRRWCAS
jgi:hypothetical protein